MCYPVCPAAMRHAEAVGRIGQFAVLAFPTRPEGLPDHVDTLDATGATVAFVTGSVEVL